MGWTQGRVIIGLNCCAHNRHHFPLVPSEIDVCCPWEPPLGAQCLCSPLRGCWGWAWRAWRAQTNGGGWLTGLLAEAASWQWAVMGSTLHNLPSTPPVSYCTTHRLAARAVALGSPPHLRLLVTYIWPLQGANRDQSTGCPKKCTNRAKSQPKLSAVGVNVTTTWLRGAWSCF